MRKKKLEPAGSPAWMTTYSDMVTLILCFFVLLFAFSEIDIIKLKMVSDSFRNKSIVEGGVNIISPEPPLHANTNTELDDSKHSTDEEQKQLEVQRMQEQQLDQLNDAINDYLKEHNLEGVIDTERDKEGLTLEIKDRILFDPGRANIKSEGVPFLARVGQLLVNMPNPIVVEGHTDNVPMSSAIYPSNWELSAARASGVIRFFIDNGGLDPTRMTAIGYGEYHPLVDNDTAENRAMNRRVSIRIGKLSADELIARMAEAEGLADAEANDD